MSESSQYLYKIWPARSEMLSSGSTMEEDRIIGEHFDYLKALTGKGIVKLAGRTLNTDPSSFGMVIFFADSVSEALLVMNNDPAVRQHVFQAELFPFRISLQG